MARLRKNETNVGIQGTGAAPARRKSASAPRKHTAMKPAEAGADETESPETIAAVEPVAAITVASVIIPAVTEFALDNEGPVTVIEDVTVITPSPEEIAALAYSYWVERGYAQGCPEHDWLRAEAELRQRAALVTV